MPIQVHGETYVVKKKPGTRFNVFIDSVNYPQWRQTFKRNNGENDVELSTRVSKAVLALREVRTARAHQGRRPPLSNGAARCAGWATWRCGRLGPCHARHFISLD